MKRIREPEASGMAGTSHPDAARPLSAFRRIVVSCNDCGDVTVLEEPQLAELSAVPTFGDLWRLAFCRSCREGGATGPANMELRGDAPRGTLARAAASPPEPDWSTKPVFGEDRTDPFPTLPRRPMFER
jgi:hypothetical protein